MMTTEEVWMYFDYLDRLYSKHGLRDHGAGLAELIPRLTREESTTLAKLMWNAGYSWRGLTDQQQVERAEGEER